MSNEATKADIASTMLGSSTMTACVKCGSTATYRGSPEKVNAAAKEFYEIHQQCWQRPPDKERLR
jgi:hypothetical protein